MICMKPVCELSFWSHSLLLFISLRRPQKLLLRIPEKLLNRVWIVWSTHLCETCSSHQKQPLFLFPQPSSSKEGLSMVTSPFASSHVKLEFLVFMERKNKLVKKMIAQHFVFLFLFNFFLFLFWMGEGRYQSLNP